MSYSGSSSGSKPSSTSTSSKSSTSTSSKSCSSSKSRSSSKGTKKGDDWDYKIFFDPEADTSSGSGYDIYDDDLMSKLKEVVGVNEDILDVYAYNSKLSPWQLTKFLFYHMFIVFRTSDWWWSLEKHSDGLTIQRSKQESAVKDRYRQGKRNAGISLMKSDAGRMSVFDLITWLYKENGLNKEYHWIENNCKHFATRVFNRVAKSKYM